MHSHIAVVVEGWIWVRGNFRPEVWDCETQRLGAQSGRRLFHGSVLVVGHLLVVRVFRIPVDLFSVSEGLCQCVRNILTLVLGLTSRIPSELLELEPELISSLSFDSIDVSLSKGSVVGMVNLEEDPNVETSREESAKSAVGVTLALFFSDNWGVRVCCPATCLGRGFALGFVVAAGSSSSSSSFFFLVLDLLGEFEVGRLRRQRRGDCLPMVVPWGKSLGGEKDEVAPLRGLELIGELLLLSF